MKTELVATSSLIPYARNPRKNLQAVDKVAASITEFGWRQPIVVGPDMVVIVGHTRLQAAQKLGIAEVPVHVAEGLSEAQVRAYRLADNRTNEDASWDAELLALEFEELKQVGYDLTETAFTEDEIARYLIDANPGLTDPDETPDVPAVPVSRLGDVWVLGKHRITCGDATNITDVDRVLAGVKPMLMVTDPPYGVEYDPTRTSDNPLKSGAVMNDDRADWGDAWALFTGEVAYVWHASMHTSTVLQSLERCGFEHRAMIIWVKDRFTFGRGHYKWQHEPAWYVVKKGGTGHWNGAHNVSTVWEIKSREDGGHGHGTQKPVECMRRPIENNSCPGQAVYEPFSGSGTTIIACEMTGRCCYALELSPAYVDVAVERWQKFTGQAATLDGSLDKFDELKASRCQ